MGKQVRLAYNTLYVQTRLLETNKNNFNKVIITCKGEQAQTFYKYPELALRDPDYLNTCCIMGYTVSELIIIAERLRAGGVDIIKLKDCNQAYIDGYQKAQADIEKAIQDSIKSIIERNTDV